MATLTDNPSFTANEVIALQQGDLLEGQAAGASYGGIGRSNQPAQQLANRTAFIRNNQITDEANITTLLNFKALFTGLLCGVNGSYIEIPFQDTSRGLISLILQFGQVDFGSEQGEGLFGPYNFPLAFPNAVYAVWVSTQTDKGVGRNSRGDNIVEISTANPPALAQFYVWNNNVTGINGARGFSWIALGY
jgi:hypothetical protein